MKRYTSTLSLAAALAAACAFAAAASAQNTKTVVTTAPAAPVAKRAPKQTKIHGETIVDDYFWLREKGTPEVTAYLEAENAYTDALMKPTAGLQEALYKEMLGRIKQTDTQVPYRENGYFYYSRTIEGQQYPIYARKKGSPDAAEEIVLDLNELNKGHNYTAIGNYTVSDDGNLLAYSVDHNGHRDYMLKVRDLRTGKDTEDLGKVVGAFWANDNRTLFYVTEDAAKRPHKLFRHTLGEPKEKDALVYEEKDELYRLAAYRTRSRGFVIIESGSSTTSESRYVPADRPSEAPKLIAPREEGHEYYANHHGSSFYILTNDRGRNFRLVAAPVADPSRANWKEVIAHNPDVMLEGASFFKDFYVVAERARGLQKLRITDAKAGTSHYVEFPEPVYTAGMSVNKEFDTTKLRYSYQSFTTPVSVYDYDLPSRKSELLKRQDVLGNFDPAHYTAERVYAKASDGTLIPVSLFYRKGAKRDGKAPMVLDAYGSYGIPRNATFDSNRLSLVDRGVTWAVAHIRGGGDLGKAWHDAGKMMQKKNTFTDFIAAAEHLVKEKYTSSDRLVIRGGSAGGLLLGAVVNMRPDLFRAAVNYVPFVDVMNTMLDASLPLTVQEYLEWGNPNEPAAYAYMKSYSPYDNIKAQAYPAMLVRVSLNDSQVPYWEGAKYVAKLRAMTTDKNVLLLKANMGAGHGGASGRYDALRDTAFDYAFILSQLGIAQ
ncbi:MAG TPA: S9 family peptidase [Pyrinomonadaceae bacterium]|nr:S9 family peptidase [Pyrinomonadaceae bacterium]